MLKIKINENKKINLCDDSIQIFLSLISHNKKVAFFESSHEEAIKLKPDWAITHYNLALAYERLRKYNLAKQAYRKVAEINPNSSLSDKSINRLTILGSK